MLYEIYCEKFHQKKITFNENLNVVLGTDEGHNSIGKSTFLLIVDFVFGGNTYAKSTDILNNIGDHDIFFTYKFNDKFYKFCRNNQTPMKVWECDENYHKITYENIKDFCKWLDDMYKIQLLDLSFRETIGRYIRVYGKDNCDEKHPLNNISQEKSETAILALIKLFDKYSLIKEAQNQVNNLTEEWKIFNKAQDFKFIEKITKSEYNRNTKQIEVIKGQLEEFTNLLEKQIIGVDLSISDEALNYKDLLSKTRRAQGILKAKYNVINNNQEYKFPLTNDTYAELSKYFPKVELNDIAKVEKFHNKLAEIFKDELEEEKNRLLSLIKENDKNINECEDKLRKLLNDTNIPKKILQRHASLLQELDTLQKQNAIYENSATLKGNKKESIEILNSFKNEQLSIISNEINIKMRSYNDYIYGTDCSSPILNFTKNSYDFHTPNDTGTGIAYKGLILFDLAILNLTKLPLIVHDSLLLKQIYDVAIEKILELYIRSNKQVIIAFDKKTSYTATTQRIISENTILKLIPGGGELFGKSWGYDKTAKRLMP